MYILRLLYFLFSPLTSMFLAIFLGLVFHYGLRAYHKCVKNRKGRVVTTRDH